MKKIITILIIAAIFIGCKKEIKELPQPEEISSIWTENLASEVSYIIGDQSQTPDPYIVEDEVWQGGRVGIRTNSRFYTWVKENGDTVTDFTCDFANKPRQPIRYNGDDLVVPLSTYRDSIWERMLVITTFIDGLPIARLVKPEYHFVTSDAVIGYDWTQIRRYGRDTTAIQSGIMDRYVNEARVRTGKNLIVVQISDEVLDRDRSNNTSTLPLNITVGSVGQLGTGFIDLSAIESNRTQPPTELVATSVVKTGKTKRVSIDWNCIYHSIKITDDYGHDAYAEHWFTVKKDGVIIADKLPNSEFTDSWTGAFKSAKYEVAITVAGLLQSEFKSLTITK